MLQAEDIGKTKIQLPGFILLAKLQHFLRLHPTSIRKRNFCRGLIELSESPGAGQRHKT
jgi:hypothetical protein